MARINTRPSTVAGTPADTTSTLDPTSDLSDQENRDPGGGVRGKRKGKGKHPVHRAARTTLPTPTYNGTDPARRHKRKRPQMATQDEDVDVDVDDVRFTRYYDPNQSNFVRREVQRKSRLLQREFNENRDEYLRDQGDALQETVERANLNFRNIKQTGDATLDARLLVDLSTLAAKKAANLAVGDTSTGLDVDEFLSKCLTYMRNGGPVGGDGAPTQTQTQSRRRDRDDSDNEDDEGGDLDWESIGRHACFPYNVRPACPSFLLGPLSVEKKVRVQTQRRARQTQDKNVRETRPEALTKEDMNQTDQNALTQRCAEIRRHLNRHFHRAQSAVKRIEAEEGPMNEERARQFLKDYRCSSNFAPSLLEYVVNPHSFGQTVENLFYVSFLIKEGNAGVEPDRDGLPTLVPTQPRTVDEQRMERTTKNQSVFSIDYATWQKLIDAFEITEPLIKHRDDEPQAHVGGRGWYA